MAKAPRLKPSATATPSSVDPEGAEELLVRAQLGDRIKKLRLKRSMGLVELGKQTGLSASFLSQLETGRVVPTLRNLARLSLVFGKDLSHFFESTDRRIFRIQRKKDRIRLPSGSPPDYVAESFSILIPEGGLRPCAAELIPNGAPFRPESYPGLEMLYVLSGSVVLEREGTPHALGPRDALYISSETPRTYRCDGSEPANVLILSFDSEPRTPRHRPNRPAGSSTR